MATRGAVSVSRWVKSRPSSRRMPTVAKNLGATRLHGTEQPGVGDLYLVSMKSGEPRRLTNWNGVLGGVVWTPDGRDLI